MSTKSLLLLLLAVLLLPLVLVALWYLPDKPIIASHGWQWQTVVLNLPKVAGIWRETDGSLLVSQDGAENGCSLTRIGVDQSRTVLADNLSEPDVVQRHAMGMLVSEERGDRGISVIVDSIKRQIVSLPNAEGFTVSPDGHYLLVAEDCAKCKVIRIDLHTGEQLILAENLMNPEGVCLLGDQVYFTEKGRGRMSRVALQGGTAELLNDQLTHPSALACDNQRQEVWVGEESVNFGRIQRYDGEHFEVVARLLGEPQEIHIIPDGVLVAEYNRGRIVQITRDPATTENSNRISATLL